MAAALAIYPAAFAGDQVIALALLGVPAVLLSAVAATGLWPAGAGWAAGLLGAEYVASLYLAGESLGVATPIYAALLLLLVELVYLAAHLAVPTVPGEPALRRRLTGLGAMLALSLLAGTFLLALALVPLRSGLALTAAGMAAAVGALGLALAVARRH